jgi:hypothetical protein
MPTSTALMPPTLIGPANRATTSISLQWVAGCAGIRDGQELFRWSVYYDDPSKDALLGVVIDGQRRMISFSPTKQAHIEQYRASVSGEAASNCTPF